MDKTKILFVCTYFGGRARIAELYAGQMGLKHIEVVSSGFEAGAIGGLPLMVMEEEGFSFSTDPLVTVFDRYSNSETFDYVITLCHDASTEHCPMFRDSVDLVYGRDAQILGWSIPDFLALKGVPVEKLEGAREIRDMIKVKVLALLSQL
mgnify:CR=1 FL=1